MRDVTRVQRNCLAGCMVMVLAAMSGTAMAAAAEQGGAASPSAAESSSPGDIIVTARRSAERLQDTPVAVTVVTEASFKAMNLADSRDLQRITPSVSFTQGTTPKLQNFSVRGVGTFISADAFDQSVGVAFDGVPLARPGGSIADLIDIERAEILEGPQGMLFGKNASAGLVNIITRKPVLDETSVSGRMSYGSFNELQANATVNLPIGDTLALRGSVWRFRHDGYLDSPNYGRKLGEKNSGGARLRLLWKPTDALDVNLFAERGTADQDPAVTTIRVITGPGSGLAAYEASQGVVPGPNNLRTSSREPVYTKVKTTALVGEVAYDLGGPSLVSTTAYRKIHTPDKSDAPSTSSPIVRSNAIDDSRYRQFSQEVRLASAPGSKLKWVVGGIYFDFKLHDNLSFNVYNGVPVTISDTAVSDIRSKHYGLFGEITYPIIPSVRIIAGARSSWDKVSADFNRFYTNGTPAVVIGPFNGPNSPAGTPPVLSSAFGPFQASGSVKDSEWSYRAGLEWDAAKDVMLYTTVSRGYKAAGIDTVNVLSAASFAVAQGKVKPEISMNYEAGLRSQFFDRHVTLNATVWHEVFTNFQTSVRLPLAVPATATQNAKQLKSDGASVMLDVLLTKGLRLTESVAYTDARYTDFTNAACAPAGAGVGVCGAVTPGLQSLNGVALNNAPKWKNNITLRYDGEGLFKDDWRFYGQINARTQSKELFNAANDKYERQGGYSVVNIGAGFGPADKRWTVSVYGNNIFEKRFVARTVQQSSGLYYVNVVPYDSFARWGVALDFAL